MLHYDFKDVKKPYDERNTFLRFAVRDDEGREYEEYTNQRGEGIFYYLSAWEGYKQRIGTCQHSTPRSDSGIRKHLRDCFEYALEEFEHGGFVEGFSPVTG
jgi:hypothetical protein